MSDKHLLREPASVPAAEICSLQYFSFKSGNQIFGFLLGEHKGSGGRRGGVSTYDKTLNIMHLYIYYINTRPDDTFIHKV